MRNQIGDDNLKYITNVKFKFLKYLYLYSNKIKSYEWFYAISSTFPFLKKLQIGSNKFDYEDKYKNQIYDFKNLIYLGMTNGVFSQKTINEHFCRFKLNNLKELYLSGNNLDDISFLNNMKNLDNLGEIWLKDNNLKTFENLFQLKNLNIINVSGNEIIDISFLDKYKDLAPKFKKIDLTNNKIKNKNIDNPFKSILKFY
jgi:predicted RNA-binding protein